MTAEARGFGLLEDIAHRRSTGYLPAREPPT